MSNSFVMFAATARWRLADNFFEWLGGEEPAGKTLKWSLLTVCLQGSDRTAYIEVRALARAFLHLRASSVRLAVSAAINFQFPCRHEGDLSSHGCCVCVPFARPQLFQFVDAAFHLVKNDLFLRDVTKETILSEVAKKTKQWDQLVTVCEILFTGSCNLDFSCHWASVC